MKGTQQSNIGGIVRWRYFLHIPYHDVMEQYLTSEQLQNIR